MQFKNILNKEFNERFSIWLTEQSPKDFKNINGFEIVKSFLTFEYGENIEFEKKDFKFFISYKRELIEEIEKWLKTFELKFDDYRIYFELFTEDLLLENEISFENIFAEFKDYINEEGFVIDKSEINKQILKEIYITISIKTKSKRRKDAKILHSEIKQNIELESADILANPKIKKTNTIEFKDGIDLSKCFDCNKVLNLEDQKRHIRYGKYCKDCLILRKRAYKADYKKLNSEKTSAQKSKYKRNRMKRDVTFKILHRLRTRILLVLHGKRKADSSMNLLGCSAEDLKKHLEDQFKDDMSWDNYGIKGWHIDHIKPCASFDLSVIEEQKKCFHFTNLQPLWWHENLSKSDKII